MLSQDQSIEAKMISSSVEGGFISSAAENITDLHSKKKKSKILRSLQRADDVVYSGTASEVRCLNIVQERKRVKVYCSLDARKLLRLNRTDAVPKAMSPNIPTIMANLLSQWLTASQSR